jgi:hypothetical protein
MHLLDHWVAEMSDMASPPPAKRARQAQTLVRKPAQFKDTVLFEFDGRLVELANVKIFLLAYCTRYVDRPLKIFPWASREVLEANASARRNIVLNHLEFSFIAETKLPTKFGEFRVRAYRDLKTMKEPMVIISGDVEGKHEVPLRVHDQCFTSEVLGKKFFKKSGSDGLR